MATGRTTAPSPSALPRRALRREGDPFDLPQARPGVGARRPTSASRRCWLTSADGALTTRPHGGSGDRSPDTRTLPPIARGPRSTAHRGARPGRGVEMRVLLRLQAIAVGPGRFHLDDRAPSSTCRTRIATRVAPAVLATAFSRASEARRSTTVASSSGAWRSSPSVSSRAGTFEREARRARSASDRPSIFRSRGGLDPVRKLAEARRPASCTSRFGAP